MPHANHPNAPADPLAGRIVDGRYRLGERIGEGGNGLVYSATQLSMEREVALKLLPAELAADPRARRRFEREAQAAASLNHPNVVTIHDFGCTPDGVPYLVMERIRGESLASRIARGPMRPARAAWVVGEVLRALREAHRQQVVHRDLKPENVLLERCAGGERVKVVDFGLARLMDTSVTAFTRPGAVLGTPHYMSPEQCRGEPAGPAADLYACGALLYALLTGRPPFTGRTAVAIATQHLAAAVPEVDAPPHLRLAVQTAMAKRVQDRFGSAREMLQALGREAPTRRAPTLRAGTWPTLRLTA